MYTTAVAAVIYLKFVMLCRYKDFCICSKLASMFRSSGYIFVWLAQLVKAQPSAACVHVQSCMTVREVLSSTPGQTGSPKHASFSGS